MLIKLEKRPPMSYHPNDDALTSRRWFPRTTFYDHDTLQHAAFPVVRLNGSLRCLCRECAPSANASEEETLQTIYLKALEMQMSQLSQAVGERGRPIKRG
jgi:hypothetical protein